MASLFDVGPIICNIKQMAQEQEINQLFINCHPETKSNTRRLELFAGFVDLSYQGLIFLIAVFHQHLDNLG